MIWPFRHPQTNFDMNQLEFKIVYLKEERDYFPQINPVLPGFALSRHNTFLTLTLPL